MRKDLRDHLFPSYHLHVRKLTTSSERCLLKTKCPSHPGSSFMALGSLGEGVGNEWSLHCVVASSSSRKFSRMEQSQAKEQLSILGSEEFYGSSTNPK
jgi:hypothetical protein